MWIVWKFIFRVLRIWIAPCVLAVPATKPTRNSSVLRNGPLTQTQILFSPPWLPLKWISTISNLARALEQLPRSAGSFCNSLLRFRWLYQLSDIDQDGNISRNMSRNAKTLLYLGPIVNCQPLWLHKFHWLHSAAVTASSCVSLDYHCDCYRTPHQCRCTCMYTYHRTQAPQLTRPLRCQLLSLCFPIWRLDFRYRIRGYRNSWNYLYNMENILQYGKKTIL